MGAASLQERAKVVGRYALHGEVASGGMASVRIGRFVGPAGFTRTVAIKQLHPHFTKDPEFFAMFRDEAHLAARIRHGNVVPVLDVVAEGDQLLLVMEYVPGASLARLMRLASERREKIPAPIVSAILAGVLTGLHAAHEAKDESGQPLGVVHRDVSPQNILVGTDGIARVVDFGVAKAAGRLQTTRDGQLKGKMQYMAPEQLGGRAIDRRTDVYAAAVVMWEAITGKTLFRGENDVEVFGKVLRGATTAPSELAPGLPPAYDTIVMRALRTDPDERYPDAREMAQAIAHETRVATPADVSDWLSALAADELAERARLVADVESGVVSSRETATGTLAEDDLAPTEIRSPSSQEEPLLIPLPNRSHAADTTGSGTARFAAALNAPSDRPRRRGRRRVSKRAWIAIGTGLVAAVGLVLYVVLAPRTPDHVVAPATALAPLEAPPASSPASTPAQAPAPNVDPLDLDRERPPSASASTARPKVPAKPMPRPGTTKPAKSDCDPPYYFDATGTKRYKRECG